MREDRVSRVESKRSRWCQETINAIVNVSAKVNDDRKIKEGPETYLRCCCTEGREVRKALAKACCEETCHWMVIVRDRRGEMPSCCHATINLSFMTACEVRRAMVVRAPTCLIMHDISSQSEQFVLLIMVHTKRT